VIGVATVGPFEFPDDMPIYVKIALEGLLTDVYSEDVREDIVTALTWGMQNAINAANYVNSLGLTVWDHKLCYTSEDVLPLYDDIPSEIRTSLDRILTDVYGVELREDIVTALRWGTWYTSVVAQFINDLGLTVVDGKLCAIFYPDGV